MFNPHLTDIVKVRDLLFLAEIAAHLALNGLFVGCEVIHYHCYTVFVIYLFKTEFAELTDRNGRGNVVSQNAVKIYQNQLSGFDCI